MLNVWVLCSHSTHNVHCVFMTTSWQIAFKLIKLLTSCICPSLPNESISNGRRWKSGDTDVTSVGSVEENLKSSSRPNMFVAVWRRHWETEVEHVDLFSCASLAVPRQQKYKHDGMHYVSLCKKCKFSIPIQTQTGWRLMRQLHAHTNSWHTKKQLNKSLTSAVQNPVGPLYLLWTLICKRLHHRKISKKQAALFCSVVCAVIPAKYKQYMFKKLLEDKKKIIHASHSCGAIYSTSIDAGLLILNS